VKPHTAQFTREAWLTLLDELNEPDYRYRDADGRAAVEVVNRIITITDTADAEILVRELQRQPYWVYPTPDELRASMLQVSSTHGAGGYSERLFGANGQVDDFLIPLLKEQPRSRRALVCVYDAARDSDSITKETPVIVSVQFRVFDSLEVTATLRASDLFLGFPAQVFQLRQLQEYVAKKLGARVGCMHLTIASGFFFTEYEELLAPVAKVIKKER
jgi:hypothetical protein